MSPHATNRTRLILFLLILSAATAAWADLGHHEGNLVFVDLNRIVITRNDGTGPTAYPLVPLVRVNRNGRDATVADLVRGDQIQILTESRFGREFVTSVLAVRP